MKPKGLLANAALRTLDEWLMMIVFHCAQDHFARKHVASLVRNDDPCIFIWIWAAVNPSPLWRLLTLRLGSQCTWGQDTIPAGSNLELCRRGSRQQREVHGVPLDLSPPARCTILLQVRPNLRKEFLLKSKSLRDSLRMCYWWNTSWANIDTQSWAQICALIYHISLNLAWSCSCLETPTLEEVLWSLRRTFQGHVSTQSWSAGAEICNPEFLTFRIALC